METNTLRTNLTASGSCREYLNKFYDGRKRKNPAYSMRSLARDLKVSPATLCLLFKNKRRISARAAIKISQHLPVTENELEHWHSLVFLEQPVNPISKEYLMNRQDVSPTSMAQQNEISVELFKSISEWQHLAIMSATELDKDFTHEELAHLLHIDKTLVEESIERLIRLGLLERVDGKLKKKFQSNIIRSKERNQALREYHLQMVNKSAEAIKSQDNTKKFTGTMTLAVDPRQLEEFQDIFRSFIRKVIRVSDKGKRKDRLYHLNLNFFDLFDGRNV